MVLVVELVFLFMMGARDGLAGRMVGLCAGIYGMAESR